MSSIIDHATDDTHGDNWHMMLGDSCERLSELNDDSIGLSVYSPPFDSLYTYSPTPRDLGNSATRDEFLEHYAFIVREVLRVTMPGRISCVHVQQVSTTKATHGYMGLTDFRGDVIRLHEREGWIFHGEVTVDKCPQAQAIRTKSHALMFQTLKRDSAGNRPAMADYVILFRKHGDNPEQIKNDVTNDEWIEWARPIWRGIRETNVLNVRGAREEKDERHLCPLQLDLIERCVRMWSNPGELVLSPFAGVGSEGYEAVKHGRRFVGIELKPSYYRSACENLKNVEEEIARPRLEVAQS